MPVPVQGPDGNTYQFPDGTDKAAAISYFKKKGIGAAPAPEKTPEKKGFWQSYDEKVAPLVTPTPHDYKSLAPGKNGQFNAGAYGKEAVTALSNMGAGGLGVILHPVNTVGGILKTAYDTSPVGGLVNQFQGKDPIGDMAKDAALHPLETAETMAGQTAAFDAGMKGIGKLTKLPGKVIRAGQESLTKTSPSDVANLVRDTSAKNVEEVAKAGEADKKAAADHLEKTQDALHETKGRELQHERDVKAAKDDAERKRKLDLKKHLETRDKAIADRKEAEEKVAAEKAKQSKIEPTQNKLQTAWSNLRAGIETAREKALKIGNEKYNAVNDKLSSEPSNREFIQNAFVNATEKLRGSHSDPTLLKDVERTLKTEGDIPYSDLQGDYSRLGKELTKGTLDGDVFYAYDQLHEALGTEMQRIADAHDLGPQLTEARNYWRRMKQTFGKPFNPTDAATSTAEKAAPNAASSAEQANRIRLLGSFDPDLPGQFENVGNIRKGVDSLPKPKPERDIVQGAKAPSIPPRKPVLPKVEPKPVPPPDRVAPPDRPQPTPAKTTTLTPQTLSDMKGANVDKSAADFRSPNKLATTFLGYDLMRNAFNALGNAADLKFGTAAKDLFKSVRDVGIRVGYQMGSGKLADLLENPETRARLSQITDRDIAELRKLSPEQQAALGSELKALVDAAPSKGVTVSPALSAWVGSVSGAGPKQKIGDILKPK